MLLADFETVAMANEGIKLDLVAPNGDKTDHWLQIVGRDSDIYRKQFAKAKQAIAKVDGNEHEEVKEKIQSEFLASLIIDWSFDEELTIDRARDWLTNAPMIREEIDKISMNRAALFRKKPKG